MCCANLAGSSCATGGLSINSNCYQKFDISTSLSYSLSWFNASNRCLYIGRSLASFSDMRRPSDNRQLTDWLNPHKIYWIGLVRPWWKTTDEGYIYRDSVFSLTVCELDRFHAPIRIMDSGYICITDTIHYTIDTYS